MRNNRDGTSVDVLVLVALKDELDALSSVDAHKVAGSKWTEAGEPEAPYLLREFSDVGGGRFRVAAARTTEQRETAIATLGGILVTKLHPRSMAMCGVCASPRSEVHQGDVIVADLLFRYDMGKLVTVMGSDGEPHDTLFREIKTYSLIVPWLRAAQDSACTPPWDQDLGFVRPISFRLQEHWMREAMGVYEGGGANPVDREDGHDECPDWTEVLRRLRKRKEVKKNELLLTAKGRNKLKQAYQEYRGGPKPDEPMKIHVGPIATVTNVIQDLDENGRARIFNAIRKQQHRDIRAIEMEATAVGHVAEIKNIPCIVAKGVQDHADEDKDDRYRQFAARASARFLIEFFHQQLGTLNSMDRPVGCRPQGVTTSEASLVETPDRVDDPIVGVNINLEDLGLPLAHPAQALDELDYKNFPLDLGTIWGIERGSFVGVLFGDVAEQLRKTLIRSERAFEDALSQSVDAIDLPRRRWFKVNAESCPSGPRSEDELWRACIGDNAEIADKIRKDVVQGGLLGFLVVLTDSGTNSVALASRWTRCIFSGWFPVNQCSLIFCASADSSYGKRLVAELHAVASDIAPGVHIESMRAVERLKSTAEAPIVNKSPTLFEELSKDLPVGLGVGVWLEWLVAEGNLELRELTESFPGLSIWIRQLDESVKKKIGTQKLIDIAATCRDLEWLFENEANFSIGREVLAACVLHDPVRVGALLEATAHSPSYRLRREALVVAVTNEEMLSDWLRGANYLEDDLLREGFLVADPRPIADALALGILRVLNTTDPDDERWTSLLNMLRSAVKPEVEQVCMLCMGELDEEEFWRKEKGQSYLAAVRAGCRLRPGIEALTKEGLQHQPPWWLLMACVPDSEWLASILQLPSELRWILGLVSREEREELRKQATLVEAVVACRRGRACAL